MKNEPLSKHTYYRIGGPADQLEIPTSIQDLKSIAEEIQKTKSPFFILGLGSNILASDVGFRGTIIKSTRIDLGIELINPQHIRVGASVANSTLLRKAAQEGWAGLEFLTGIPGSIGGAVAMNAGTHLGEVKDRIVQVDYFSLSQGKVISTAGNDLKFEYRKNLFLPSDAIVTSTLWRITPDNPADVKARIDELLQRRKQTQPIDYPSCGSVFKNPKAHGMHAWQVIDKLGLRGHQIGKAQFSEKHPNFIINLGEAKAADVYGLMQLAKQRAQQELNVPLEEEVKYLGLQH